MSGAVTPSRPYVPPMGGPGGDEGAGRSSRRHHDDDLDLAQEYQRQLYSRDASASRAESRRRVEREAEAMLRKEAERQGGASSYAPSEQSSARPQHSREAWTEERREQAERERNEWTKSLNAKKAAMQKQGHGDPALDRGKTILIMTVDIGDGRQGTIEVHARDKPRDLAVAFCEEHGLADNVVDPLTEHVRNNIDAIAPKKPSRRPPKPQDGRPSTQSTQRGTARRDSAKQQESEVRRRSSTGGKKGFGYDISAAERDEYLRRMSTEYPRVLEERLEQLREQANEEYRKTHTLKPKIDPKSRKLASKGRRKGNVFDRLHQDGARRLKEREEAALVEMDKDQDQVEQGRVGMSWVSREIMKSVDPSSQGYQNYGEKLYQEGLAMMEQKRKNAEAKKLKEELNPDPELTFRPKISKKAKQLSRTHDEHVLDTLGDLRWMQKKKLAAEAEERMMSECTFKPQLNRITERLVETHVAEAGDAYTTRYDALYQDAVRRQSRQTEYSEWLTQEHTFHPDIGMNRHYPTKDQSKEDFVARLAYGKQTRDSLMEDVRKGAAQENRDPTTGSPLFKPKTGRSPAARRESKKGKPIGEYLYSTAQQYKKMHEHLEKEYEKEVIAKANKPKITKQSQRVANQAMNQRLGEIFDELTHFHPRGDDRRNDNRIQPATAECEALEPEARKELVPLLRECRDHFLSRAEFIRFVGARLRKSKSGPRPWLYSHPKGSKGSKRKSVVVDHEKEEVELTFRPKIDPRSEALAEQRSAIPVVDRLHAHLDMYAQNRQRLYEQQLEGELSECTFTPHIDEVSAAMQARSAMDTKLEDRLTRKSLRPDSQQMTTEDRELLEECTFQPNTSPTRRKNRSIHRNDDLRFSGAGAAAPGLRVGSSQPVSIGGANNAPRRPLLADWEPRPLSDDDDDNASDEQR